jgi:hypothetical protein
MAASRGGLLGRADMFEVRAYDSGESKPPVALYKLTKVL